MSVTLDEKDLEKVETQKNEALNDLNNTYDGMINDYTAKTDKLINESENWVDTQTKLQEDRLGLEIEEIENQRAKAEKDYLKEQSGAYKDWQKQSNKYGAEAERQASMGMANSGYSESSQVSMYNNYQNRVAAARQAFVRADTDYKLAMNNAKLQNDIVLAEIAYKGYQEQLAFVIESMQYKNSLLIQKTSEKRAIENTYYTRWMDLYSQLKKQELIDSQNKENQPKIDKSQVDNNAVYGPSKPVETPSKKTTDEDAPEFKNKDELKVDMASVYALGYGRIDAARLNTLVKIGEVIEIVDPIKGVITYKKANPSAFASKNFSANEIAVKSYLQNQKLSK